MNRKFVFTAIRSLVSLSLIVLLFYFMRDKSQGLFDIIKKVNIPIYILALVAFVIAIYLGSYRLKWILEAQECPINLAEAASLTFIGYFFNNFLPTAIGGDVVKAYYASHKSKDKVASFAAVFIDRVIGLMTYIFMGAIALFFATELIDSRKVAVITYLLVGVSVLAIAFVVNKDFAKFVSRPFFFLKPLEHRLKRLYDAMHRLRHHRMLLLNAFLISVICQIFYFSSIYLLAGCIGHRVFMRDIFIRMPLVCMASLMPSIGGLGVREWSIIGLFRPLIGEEAGVALSMLLLANLFLASLVGGMIYAASPQFKFRPKHEAK